MFKDVAGETVAMGEIGAVFRVIYRWSSDAMLNNSEQQLSIN